MFLFIESLFLFCAYLLDDLREERGPFFLGSFLHPCLDPVAFEPDQDLINGFVVIPGAEIM